MRWVWRLARWIFLVAADLSLLLCVCSVVFWVRSCWIDDVAEWRRDSRRPLPEMGSGVDQIEFREIVVGSGHSGFQMRLGHFVNPVSRGSVGADIGPALLELGHNWPSYTYTSTKKVWNVVDGFGLQIECANQQPINFRESYEVLGVAARHWMLVVMFGVLPVIRAVMWMSRRRKREGNFCENCGYDLRESKERCPECGLAVESVVRT
jgi:hypothetical protein